MELVIDFTMKKHKPLFLRLFLSYTPIIIIGIFLLILLVYFSTNQFYNGLIKKELQNRANIVFDWIETNNSKINTIQDIATKSSNNKTVRVTIIIEDGTVVGDSHKNPDFMDNHQGRKEIIQAIKNGSSFSLRFSKTLNKELMYYALSKSINDKIWIVRISIPLEEYRDTISTLQLNIVFLGVFVVLALLFLSYFISKQVTAPLDVIRKETEKYVSTLKITTPLKIPNTRELASLASSLNKMALELNKRIKQIKNEKDDKVSILSSMQEGILAIDTNKKIISINDIAIQYLNLNKKTILKKTYSSVIENKKLKKIIKKSISTKIKTHQIFQKEIEIINNKTKYYLINTSPLIRSGKNKGVLIVLNDITHQKQLEKVRQDFVANVSHELKTPITSIIGFVEILNQRDLTKDEQDLFLEKILNHTNRMNAIIDDLLKLSKIESQEEDDSIELIEQNLLTILEAAREDFKESTLKNNNTINIRCDKTINVKVDSFLLREALYNLLENAAKYGYPNTEVNIIVEKKERVFIHVENQGEDINPKYWEKIFQRFYRIDKSRNRKAGGTGLGLAIVKHITFVNGGGTKVSQSKNHLTRFTISLPLIKVETI